MLCKHSRVPDFFYADVPWLTSLGPDTMAHDHSDMVGYLAFIPEFDGKSSGLSVIEFLNQVNEVGNVCNWDENKRILIARLKMRGLARLFLNHSSEFNNISVWTDFCSILKKRFIPVINEITKVSQYLEASQKAKESILDFASRLSMLHDRAKPPPADESIEDTTTRLAYKCRDMKPLFIRGLFDQELTRHVMVKNPNSFQQAVEFASQLDASEKAFNCMHQNPLRTKSPLSGVAHVKIKKMHSKLQQTPINSLRSATAAFKPSGKPAADYSHSQTLPQFSTSRGGFHSDNIQTRRDSFQGRRDSLPQLRSHSHLLSGRSIKANRNHTKNIFTECYKCGAKNHYATGCTTKLVNKLTNNNFTSCYKCGAKNHFANGCINKSIKH
jgi:hypothetical protein